MEKHSVPLFWGGGKYHGKLQWHCFDLGSLENVLTMERFQLITTTHVKTETLLVFFWEQASVPEILFEWDHSCLIKSHHYFSVFTCIIEM